MDAAALHPDLHDLAFLLGTWRGSGAGLYPTIDDFVYDEEIEVAHVGDTYLTYLERSWAPDDGSAIHLERGFIRPGSGGEAELVLAHPLGMTEVAQGTIQATTLTFATAEGGMGHTTTGAAVTGVIRRYTVEGDALTYELDMAMDGTPMTRHLAASLRRVR